jgi:hypothetical protein
MYHHEGLSCTAIGTEEAILHSEITHELDSLTRTGEALESDAGELVDGHESCTVGLTDGHRFKSGGACGLADGELVFVLDAEVGLKVCKCVVDLRDLANGLRVHLPRGGEVGVAATSADKPGEILQIRPNGTHRPWLMVRGGNHGHSRVTSAAAIIRFGDENRAIGGSLFPRNESGAGGHRRSMCDQQQAQRRALHRSSYG